MKLENKIENNKAASLYQLGEELESEGKYQAAILNYLEAFYLGHLGAPKKLSMDVKSLGISEDVFFELLNATQIDYNFDPFIQGVQKLSGIGKEVDVIKGIQFLLISANNHKNQLAQCFLGFIIDYFYFSENCKTKKNFFSEQSHKFYQLAADQGYALGQFYLGNHYEHGISVTQDYNRSAHFYRLAADQGLAAAQVNLGTFYQLGLGVVQDSSEAVRFYQLAADQGFATAQYNLGICYSGGIGVAKNFDKAAHFFRLAADQGLATAQCNLGGCYEFGRGVPQDLNKAASFYQLAADQGFDLAQFNLGVCYENGEGVPQDFKEAAHFYQLAADQDFPEAQYNLGMCYEKGRGVKQDYTKAITLFEKSYFNVSEVKQNTIDIFLLQHSLTVLNRIKTMGNPVKTVKDIVNNEKNILARAHNCKALLNDEKISATILKDEESADLIGMMFYEAASELNFKENPKENEQHEMLSFLLSVPHNSIFYPFALDLLASFKNAQYGDDFESAWKDGGVQKLRNSIKQFTLPYFPKEDDGTENKKTPAFFEAPGKTLSVKQIQLLNSSKLNLSSLHKMNCNILLDRQRKEAKGSASEAAKELKT